MPVISQKQAFFGTKQVMISFVSLQCTVQSQRTESEKTDGSAKKCPKSRRDHHDYIPVGVEKHRMVTVWHPLDSGVVVGSDSDAGRTMDIHGCGTFSFGVSLKKTPSVRVRWVAQIDGLGTTQLQRVLPASQDDCPRDG